MPTRSYYGGIPKQVKLLAHISCFIREFSYAPAMKAPPQTQRPLFGIVAMLFSVLTFATMDTIVKWLSSDYPTYQIMFFRSSVALIPVAVFIMMAGGVKVLKTDQLGLHIIRSVFGIGAMGCAFYGIANMPLAEAMAIFHSSPILMTALSVIMLQEKVGIRRWLAVFAGFVGMLLVVQPGSGLFTNGAVFMLIAAVFVALTSNVIRKLSRLDDPACITFYFTFSATVVTGIASLLWGWIKPDTTDLLMLIAVGLLGGCGQYLMSLSFKNAEVGLVSPLKYLMIVFGGVFGYLFWSELPNQIAIIGIAVIISSGVYTMHRETRLNRVIAARKVPNPGQ